MIQALRYTEDLEKAGFTPEQAKKTVIIWMELMDQNFATKSDYREQGLKNEMALADLRAEIKKVGSDLTIKLGIMMVTTVGAISTIISLIR